MTDTPSKYTARQVLPRGRIRQGFIKCRMVHLPGATILQPDVLLSSEVAGRKFYIPQYFYAPRLTFDEGENDFCQLPIAMANGAELIVNFFKRDLLKTCEDGSQIYRCSYVPTPTCKAELVPEGMYRRNGDRFELALYHHTSEEGHNGIFASRTLRSSQRNIKGDGWLTNIAYGYLTSVPRIRTEWDLLQIAMSTWGMTGLLPVNAVEHPSHASWVGIPTKHPGELPHSLRFWVDCEYLSPSHAWVKRPHWRGVYYEVVLHKVLRIGMQVGQELPFDADLSFRPVDGCLKRLKYIVVGDGDIPEGLVAPFHEEETASVGKIEPMMGGDDFFSFWQANANTDLFSNKELEYAAVAR
jgi:hypothetical protein